MGSAHTTALKAGSGAQHTNCSLTQAHSGLRLSDVEKANTAKDTNTDIDKDHKRIFEQDLIVRDPWTQIPTCGLAQLDFVRPKRTSLLTAKRYT